jgi:hypothetical protein
VDAKSNKEQPMPTPRVVTKVTRLCAEDRPDTTPDTTFVSAANACADCALQRGPACPDCIDHAFRGFGLVHRTPIVRH